MAVTELASRQLKNAWTAVFKTGDQTKTSNTTLADDDTLLFAMLANTKYFFRLLVFFDTTAAADFKFRHVGPASPTIVRIRRGSLVPGAGAPSSNLDTAFSAADVALAGTGTIGGYVELSGIIHNGPNAGNFSFQWAQNSSDGGNTIVRAGSYLEYKQI